MRSVTGREARVARAAGTPHAAFFVLVLALAGCSGSTTSGMGESAQGTRRGSGNSLLRQVRAAGQVGNEVDVQPLRDPQVEDLRTAATLAENKGDYAGAQRVITRALAVTPNDPDLLQWQGELALVARNWSQAEQLATRSYELGPKLGGLCRRNWMTIHFAAQARGDAARASLAQQRVAACTVAPPLRM